MSKILNFDSDDKASGMTAEARHDEAVRILKLLIQGDVGSRFTDWERTFCTRMLTATTCSFKQLISLREIKEKYLD